MVVKQNCSGGGRNISSIYPLISSGSFDAGRNKKLPYTIAAVNARGACARQVMYGSSASNHQAIFPAVKALPWQMKACPKCNITFIIKDAPRICSYNNSHKQSVSIKTISSNRLLRGSYERNTQRVNVHWFQPSLPTLLWWLSVCSRTKPGLRRAVYQNHYSGRWYDYYHLQPVINPESGGRHPWLVN